MLPLVIRVEDLEDKSSTQAVLQGSPVHIGRNPLNEVSIKSRFVSQWHALVRFDEGSTQYMDLGSTNGTELDGKAMAKGEPAEVGPSSDLRIGNVRLHFSRAALEAKPIERKEWTQFGMRAVKFDAPIPLTSPVPSGAPGFTHELLSQFAQSYGAASTRLDTPEDVRAFLGRLAEVLETYSNAFLELRRGHEQFGKEIAVRTSTGASPLHQAKTAAELLRYLLDGEGKSSRAQELMAGFVDVMVHQVALLNGMRGGVRSLLQRLGPEAIDRQLAKSHVQIGPFKLPAGLWPFRTLARWRGYLEQHKGFLEEEQQLTSAVFGPDFARAYATVMNDGGGRALPAAGKS